MEPLCALRQLSLSTIIGQKRVVPFKLEECAVKIASTDYLKISKQTGFWNQDDAA